MTAAVDPGPGAPAARAREHPRPPARLAHDRPGDARIQFLIEATIEMRIQAFLEGLPDAMLGVDRAGAVCFANREAETLFGRPRAELVGVWAESLFGGATGNNRPSSWHASLGSRDLGMAGRSIEFRARRAGGGEVPVEIVLSLIATQQGPWALAAIRDMTGRKRAEEALRASEGRFRALLDSAPDAAVIVDGAGDILLVNEQTERVFGYTRAELVGQPVNMLLPERFRDPAGSHQIFFANLHSSHSGPVREAAAQRSDGSEFPAEVSLGALDSNGEILGMAFIRDITQRKGAEEALRASEDRYRQILATANEAFVAFDPDGSIVDWNTKAESIFGWSREEAIAGRLPEVIIPRSGWDAFGELLCVGAGDSQRAAVTALRRSGEEFPIEIMIWPNDGAGGRRFNALIQDVTERRRTEEAVTAARAEAERRAEELGQRNREIVAVSEMGDLLQSCVTRKEIHDVLAQFGPRLFPDASGGIFLHNPAGNLVEAAVTWGPRAPGATVFGSEDCWALRRGRPHRDDPQEPRPHCPHREPAAAGSICIPMMAQSQALGLVHLIQNGAPDPSVPGGGHPVCESTFNLAATVAEHVGLALANFTLRETLRTQSIRDPLTSLFNRRYLEESLERELRRAAREGKPLAVAMLDIDLFKTFNDELGHDVGDQLLIGLSQLLQDAVRGADIACRLGGEEFLLVLPDTSLEVACRRANELRERVGALVLPTTGRPVAVSIGVATYPAEARSGPDLLRAADMALYAAKQSGRNRVQAAGSAPSPPGLA